MKETTNTNLEGIEVTSLDGKSTAEALPLVIRPSSAAYAHPDFLKDFLGYNKEWTEEKMLQHGAVLFRGFQTNTAQDFENTALKVDENLQEHYYGTSPRKGNTRFTFSASEFPPHYPIMQHCEMSFLPTAPRRIFFFCKIAPQEGGETPITDFKKVAEDLNPEIREAFEQKGIRNYRNYDASYKSKGGGLMKKTWDDMFKTTDKADVEKQCQEQGLTPIWHKNDRLSLVNDQDAFKKHPQSGEQIWFNHTQVFHTSAVAYEYQHIAKRQKKLKRKATSMYLDALTAYKRTFVASENQDMHVTFQDGTEIPKTYIKHLQDTIWKNMVFLKWEQGDVIALDNFRVSHGRMPFEGPRNIMVSWSD